MIITIALLAISALAVLGFINQPQFGKLPSGERLQRIEQSPNYKNGSFQNQSFTPVLAEGESFIDVASKFFFGKKERVSPEGKIPTQKTDLKNLDINENVFVWFGHSSYFIQINKKRILVDPVLSGAITPLPFGNKAFPGTDVYTVDEIPQIDYLIITHDHWDHLDYKTIMALKPKIQKVICGLGVGEHFEYWGYPLDKIIEKDWYEQIALDDSLILNTTPARHFSGRGLSRNKSLWMSYVLQASGYKIFIGGDGGYDTHFSEIGKNFGPIDLAILEQGQYNKSWRNIHLLPEEALKAASELQAKRVMPVHNSKFVLSVHPWDEPLNKISENSKKLNFPIITPMIGEKVNLKDSSQKFSEWWKRMK